MDKPVKQVIVIRKDPKLRRGKEISQGAHAAMSWLTRRLSWISVGTDERPHVLSGFFTEPEYQWITGNFRKITCQVSSLEALMQVHADAIDAGLEARVITDAGLTEFHGQPTITAIAIGPDYDEKIDPITGHLELY